MCFEQESGHWSLCKDLHYTHDAGSMIAYHKNLTLAGYRALIYSGDHDMCVPFTGTQAWTQSLGYEIVEEWRPWKSNAQIAGLFSILNLVICESLCVCSSLCVVCEVADMCKSMLMTSLSSLSRYDLLIVQFGRNVQIFTMIYIERNLLVQGAGHTVPEYKPRESLHFFSSWLEGKKI